MRKYIIYIGLSLLVIVFGWIILSSYQTGPASLEGVDKDGNGVWDDVDGRVADTFKNPTLRLAASKVAIQMQNGILHPEGAISIQPNLAKAFGCFRYVKKKTEAGNQATVVTIRDMVLANRGREKAWMSFNVKLSGGSYPLAEEVKENCDFDTSGL